MKAEYIDRPVERILRLQKTDSMGRTREVRDAMEQNDPKPHKLGDATRAVHSIVAEEHAQYPRVMYRLALRSEERV